MNSSITVVERLSAISGAAVFGLSIFWIATFLHRAISKSDERKRIQGRPIRWWVTGLYGVGVITGAALADNQQYYIHEIVGGLGGFGIVAGLLIGHVHGGINLLLTSKSPHSPEHGDCVPRTGMSIPINCDEGNPYAPPLKPHEPLKPSPPS